MHLEHATNIWKSWLAEDWDNSWELSCAVGLGAWELSGRSGVNLEAWGESGRLVGDWKRVGGLPGSSEAILNRKR